MSRTILTILTLLSLLLAACGQQPGSTSAPKPTAAPAATAAPATAAPATATSVSATTAPATATVPAATSAPTTAPATATAPVKPGLTPTVAAATTPAPAGPATKVTVALDWYPWANHTGLYLARERGYYQAEGLDVELYVPANPEDGLKLVAAGKDTFGISYQTDVLLARAESVPVKSVAALVQQPLNTIMTLKESNITRPRQLEGKRVGTAGLPSDDALLATMLAHDRADPTKVQTVSVGFDLIPALIGKRVDAIIGGYWVHESILAELQGFPVNVMRVEEYGVPPYYELVLIAGEQTVARQPDLVRRFLRATGRGYADAAKDHKAAIDLLVKVNPETNRAMEEKGLPLLAPLWTQGVTSFGQQTAARWQTYAEWMKQRGILSKDVNPANAVALDLVGP
jgi:putative hydroxymethylpyrimidine transport system substrate-binding protein